jgi:hypothetical protein
MRNFVFGVIVGIIVSAVGFNGITPALDNGVQTIQKTTINAFKPKLPQ